MAPSSILPRASMRILWAGTTAGSCRPLKAISPPVRFVPVPLATIQVPTEAKEIARTHPDHDAPPVGFTVRSRRPFGDNSTYLCRSSTVAGMVGPSSVVMASLRSQ